MNFQRVTVGLGTFIAVQAEGPLDAAAQARALDCACEVFQNVERVMHPTATGSDLARIAAAPGDAPLAVHPWTFEVLSLSLQLWRSSGGHFDPCIPSSPSSIGDLQLIAPSSVLTQRTALLDLGGIAKGFAVDKAVDVLVEHGCVAGLVNAGGDLRVFGPNSHALAVSAPKSARSPSEHRGFYSRITGTELPGHAVAVRAPTAAIADALTKCAVTCAPEDLRRLLEEFSASLVTVD